MKTKPACMIGFFVTILFISSPSYSGCSKGTWNHEHSAPTDTKKSTTITASAGSNITICRNNYPIGKKPKVTVLFDSETVTIEEFNCETRESRKATITSIASRNGSNQPTITKGTNEVCN